MTSYVLNICCLHGGDGGQLCQDIHVCNYFTSIFYRTSQIWNNFFWLVQVWSRCSHRVCTTRWEHRGGSHVFFSQEEINQEQTCKSMHEKLNFIWIRSILDDSQTKKCSWIDFFLCMDMKWSNGAFDVFHTEMEPFHATLNFKIW